MQVAIFGPSTTTNPVGMLLASGELRCLLRSCVPRVLHRAALPRQPWVPGVPGVRYADARSPSPRRSTGTAISDFLI